MTIICSRCESRLYRVPEAAGRFTGGLQHVFIRNGIFSVLTPESSPPVRCLISQTDISHSGGRIVVHTSLSIMSLNIPGVIVMVLFYGLVLGTGIWASFKSKRDQKKCETTGMEMALLGNRCISWVVGIFTMTGEENT